MTSISLAKALKTKNLLVKEIAELQTKIGQYNSSIAGAEVPYNTKNLLAILEQKTADLVSLKTNLNKANQAIQSKIYLISELKSQISHLRTVSTASGKIAERSFGSSNREPVEYKAQISTIELEDLIKAKEVQIDSLQEDIDQFNHTTKIDY